MQDLLQSWKFVRKQILQLIEPLSEKELLYTPPGLNNNMLWIFGHVVRSAEYLILKLSGNPLNFDQELDSYFAKGSSPSVWKSTTGLAERIKEGEKQYRLKLEKFLTEENLQLPLVEPYTTSTGITLNTIGDSLGYVSLHEAIHLGQLQLYRKLAEAIN